MNHWSCGPIGFVEIEGVFARFSVVGDQALVVAAGGIAFVAEIDGEIELVPDEGSPDPGARFQSAPDGFVEEGLVFLAAPAGVRIGGRLGGVFVHVDARTGAVFADADAAVGGKGVNRIEPARPFGKGAIVPAVIAIQGHDIGDPVDGVLVGAI